MEVLVFEPGYLYKKVQIEGNSMMLSLLVWQYDYLYFLLFVNQYSLAIFFCLRDLLTHLLVYVHSG